jgi:hypothetical protein
VSKNLYLSADPQLVRQLSHNGVARWPRDGGAAKESHSPESNQDRSGE